MKPFDVKAQFNDTFKSQELKEKMFLELEGVTRSNMLRHISKLSDTSLFTLADNTNNYAFLTCAMLNLHRFDDIDKCALAVLIAMNPNTTSDTLVELYYRVVDIDIYASMDVLNAIAKNKNVPINLLFKMCKDDRKQVRQGVLDSPNHLYLHCAYLSRDENLQVRMRVLDSPRVMQHTLETMLEDDSNSCLFPEINKLITRMNKS